jgi:O-antigen/teichoic acid export membrane protein
MGLDAARYSMQPEITGRSLSRNTLFNFVGQAVPLLVAVLAIPFIVRGLGVERFGLLSIAWVAPEYLIFFDLGLARAATKYVAEAIGLGHKDQISRVAWTALRAQLVLGLLGALGVFGIASFLTQNVLNVPAALEAEAKAMFQIVALSIPLVLVSGTLTGVLAAGQRFDLINIVNMSVNVANFVLTLVGVLYWNWRLTEIVALLVFSRLLAVVFQYRLCIGVFPFFRRSRFDLLEFRTLLSFGGWVTVSGVVVPILLYLDRFIIGASMTMAAVAYYAIPYETITKLWIIPASLVLTLFPAFSTLTGQGETKQIEWLLIRSTKLILLTLGPIVVVLAAFSREILQVWLGMDFAQQSTLAFQILAMGILLNCVVPIQYALLHAVGRPDLTAKVHLVQLPVYSVLLWWLVGLWGITGAALAQSMRLGGEALLVLFAARRLASVRFQAIIEAKLLQSLLLLVLCLGVAIGISHYLLETWIRMAALGVVFAAVGIWIWQYSLDQRDRDQLARLFRRVA